ncbi:MAG: ribosome small subunit-dependent GTPase A [Clostridia bacterium]|jgi:ribosome biogenesis GTPase|nr:ribosome small subunit-dependent GTPase A [Lachnospiraceae bacterium]NCC00708.1 ribosome small subunit-dependent GTPase A [Clostridia bacterium]NCD02721.1 ribosome small subunit-dependent GTPase A [Clostridia bacterium]
MQGKIVKGIGGFYYIHVEHAGVYECKAKGIFRNRKIKPMVGDNVEIDIIDETEKKGNIRDILPRKNELIRPAVANIDQAMVFFAAAQPEPNLGLLDRFLLQMEYRHIPTIIVFNKCDLTDTEQIDKLKTFYETSGYPLVFVSVKEEKELEPVKALLLGKTTALAGPSGAGKSSLMNWLLPAAEMETGAVSEKIKRGRHTTRHSEIFHIDEETYLFDTPGFSTLFLKDFNDETLKLYFPEFVPFEEKCRFAGCNHINEPDCGIKQAVEEGKISRGRYENYAQMYRELKEQRRY